MPDIFNNQDIQDAHEDMQNMDDAQKLQRMHDLITKLDSEYVDISSDLAHESNQMAVELNAFFRDNLGDLLELSDIRTTPDLFRQAYTLKYMIYDFINDGKVDDDLFTKYEKFGEIRRTYIEQLRDDQPKINVFPNPADEHISCDIKFSYRYAEILLASSDSAVSSTYDLQSIISSASIDAFDPYV